jgi:hypothetical protein
LLRPNDGRLNERNVGLHSSRIVYLVMAGIMAASFVIALRGMERGIPTEVTDALEQRPRSNSPSERRAASPVLSERRLCERERDAEGGSVARRAVEVERAAEGLDAVL